jgi:ABC-type dipeptide/oligopeptide/nickel transport system ATPase component
VEKPGNLVEMAAAGQVFGEPREEYTKELSAAAPAL